MSYAKRLAKATALVAAGVFTSIQAAMAAVDTTAVGTAITAAQTSSETVGGYVIAAVAGLVVIGLIISIVRKI